MLKASATQKPKRLVLNLVRIWMVWREDCETYEGQCHVRSGLSRGTGWRSRLECTPSAVSFSREDLRTRRSRRPMIPIVQLIDGEREMGVVQS